MAGSKNMTDLFIILYINDCHEFISYRIYMQKGLFVNFINPKYST